MPFEGSGSVYQSEPRRVRRTSMRSPCSSSLLVRTSSPDGAKLMSCQLSSAIGAIQELDQKVSELSRVGARKDKNPDDLLLYLRFGKPGYVFFTQRDAHGIGYLDREFVNVNGHLCSPRFDHFAPMPF